jgi:hypothetical protein
LGDGKNIDPMNRKIFQTLCLLLLVFGPIAAFAQPKLRVASVTSTPMDTVYFPNQNVIAYRVIVENIGNNQLTGACKIKLSYNSDTVEHIKRSWTASNFEVGQTDTLTFNDTIVNLTGARYRPGGNILIIWPHSENPNVQVPDTTNFPIWIYDMNGIHDPSILLNRVKVYPNPAHDLLTIQYIEARNKLERVRLVALDGRLLKESSQPLHELDLTGLPSGMYFVQFKYRDGVEGAMRIQKQN